MKKTIENNRSVLLLEGERRILSRAVIVIVKNVSDPSLIENKKSGVRSQIDSFMEAHFPNAGVRVLPAHLTREIGTYYPMDGSVSIRLDYEILILEKLDVVRSDYEVGFDGTRLQYNVSTGDHSTFQRAMRCYLERTKDHTRRRLLDHLTFLPVGKEETALIIDHFNDHTLPPDTATIWNLLSGDPDAFL